MQLGVRLRNRANYASVRNKCRTYIIIMLRNKLPICYRIWTVLLEYIHTCPNSYNVHVDCSIRVY